MPSYNHGDRRMPSNNHLAHSADISHRGTTTRTTNGPQIFRSQIARPSNSAPRASRALSVCSSEEVRQPAAISTIIPQPTSRNNRLSMLPRPSTGEQHSSVSPASSTISPQFSTQSIPSSASTLEITSLPEFIPIPRQIAPAKRPRNVLRRKAPTIGKHVEREGQKLSLVIPQTHQISDMKEATQYKPPISQSIHAPASVHTTGNESNQYAMDTTRIHGPVELASLRTATSSQPPPPAITPFIPSASTPSTRYSESPGMWSRGSTPTSLSSYSPGIVHSTKIARLRQGSTSQTRLPVFSPPATTASPQSATLDSAERTLQRKAIPNQSAKLNNGQKIIKNAPIQQTPSPVTMLRGPPHSPPPRKSSIKSSPQQSIDIDVEKARKEVDEAERELFNAYRPKTTVASPNIPVPKTPPRRPSRDGTQNLDLETSPVIRSNLPYVRSTGHTRRESAERIRTPGKDTTKSIRSHSVTPLTDSLLSKDLSRIPSRESNSPFMPRKSPRTLIKVPPQDKAEMKVPDASPKRFGLFSKKSKPKMNDSSIDQARPARKGPAAGTGHEGYGKYSQRGRKSSTGSSTGTRTRSTSTTRSASRSVASSKGSMSSRPDLELDHFFSSRLEPVVITGGGLDGGSLSRSQSEQSISSMSVASSSIPCHTTLSSSTVQSTESLPTSIGALEKTIPGDPVTRMEQTRNGDPEKRPTAARQPPQRARMPVPNGRKNTVAPILSAGATQTSHSSYGIAPPTLQSQNDTSVLSSTIRVPSQRDDKEIKKTKSSRWNLFQRNRGNDVKAAIPTAPFPQQASQPAKLHATIAPVLNHRPVAHYAIVDEDSDELERIISNIEHSPPTEEELPIAPVEVPAGLNIKKRQPSILLPSPPKLHSEFNNDRPSPKTAMFNRNIMGPEPESSPEDRRPRRLASIGRIPKVVSRRERQLRPDMQSFSRPFSVIDTPSLPAPVLENKHEYPGFEKSPPNNVSDAPSSKPYDLGHGFYPALSAPEQISALDFLAGPFSASEFLHFSPPHKGSVSSSSSGALAAVTAVLPNATTAPTEDEVWNEYDDLIDHVLSPEEPKTNDSIKSEDDDRFEKATMASRALQNGLDQPRSLQVPSFTKTDESNRDSSDSIRLRRSRIISALHSSISPSTQPSYSDLIASYGERSDNPGSPTDPKTQFSDQVQQQQSTFLHSLAAVPPKMSKPDGRKKIHEPSERDWDAVTRTNMRSASLMTSRWLSFGRVLFSPAHNHVKSGTHGRILVIDGLGNDDWSFYCSLTYPDAEVYSLSGRPVSTALPHPAAWQPPANHHTVYHAGLQNPLPFPKDYFAVAVLRFPTATSEAVQSNIVQECKRVLRSGGYLEMSILDRDMVNMGVRTRKAVRRLKEMTCLANSTISLSPASDSVQRLIGTQGFDNLRRCMVRIPVAGMVVRSSGSTTSSSGHSLSISAATQSTGYTLPPTSVSTTTGSQGTQTTSRSSPSDDNISLGDLLSDPAPSAANDASIAKIVARVGRWWYTKCYEDPVLPDTGDNDPSMWNDRKTLRECQKRGTGFRMLIAYAQKPSEVKRRTASV
ncbi:uncharacterized protein N7469_010437 [Penicillium citrinum]|uniref:Methyltransferase type 11 domain-containing protein n=1 Tax=Penicillium citrinum TaxID=5077 RepID=A0A9W9NKG0_PENCI|nr:uncharacterized protein N7469_010437 [Penicillium citrinum]KAJ5221550.1 hypothetical protein N7469_010437 [Penicillium citrinum]